jgi:hypothetical protein
MPNVLLVQDSFARALIGPGNPVPHAISGAKRRTQDRRFVYRNNVIAGLIAALGARYPVTECLVGREFFSAMARDYAVHCPPRSPVLLHYGEGFSDFVAGFEPA